jgi:hypothetical protein
MPKLEYLMTLRAVLKPPIEVGQGPAGTRNIYDVTDGNFEGPQLKGKVLPSGGDWMLIGEDGVGRLDVRAALETDDGARLFVQYYGVAVLNEAAVEALSGGAETQYGDTYFMTQPRFETGDPRYAWLNAVVAVGEGRVLPSAVEYRIYQVVNG